MGLICMMWIVNPFYDQSKKNHFPWRVHKFLELISVMDIKLRTEETHKKELDN